METLILTCSPKLINMMTKFSYFLCRSIHMLRCSWWRYQMEAISALLALCAGNSPVTGEFPTLKPVTRSFDVFFICAWTNDWVNNRDASDLRRHRAHYDVTVIYIILTVNYHYFIEKTSVKSKIIFRLQLLVLIRCKRHPICRKWKFKWWI